MISSSSRALFMAHALKAQMSHPASWSGIVKYAWYFERLRKWMSTSIVTFSYWKKDGTIREARGTLDLQRIPADKHPKGNQSAKVNHSIVNYFDLDKQEWRSFSADRFIGFVTIEKKP